MEENKSNNTKRLIIMIIVSIILVGTITTAIVYASKKGKDTASNEITDVTSNNTTKEADEVSTKEEDNAVTGTQTAFTVVSKIDEKDENVDWESANPIYLTLNNDSISGEGSGFTIDGSKITITAAGTYVFSGTLADGQIIVEAPDSKVWIVLNGVTINCSNSSAIYTKDAKKTIITVPEGTENTLTDGSTYTYDDVEKEEPNACIFSKDDMVINGTGTLNVIGNANNGIASKDDLLIVNTNINVKSYNHGIKGKDCVCIKNSVITIDAGGDGIKSTNSTELERGFVCIESGTFDITAGQDGIQAQTCMLIEDGDFKFVTGGGSANASTNTDGNWGQWGPGQMKSDDSLDVNTSQLTTTDNKTDSTAESTSAKGLKATFDITVNGGTFNLDTSDDSIHTNESITINNGTFTLASGDDGIHSDSKLTINGGTIGITKSYEGIESAEITFNDGNIDIVASDDGINAAGGNDSSSTVSSGRPGANSFDASDGSVLNINGGTILINASGDGIDSNGDVNMTAGTVTVYGPTNGGNGALDYNGSFNMTGGTLVAAGATGMAESISSTSTQYGLNYILSSSASANSTFTVKDSSENIIIEVTPTKSYQSVVVSTKDLKDGETYTVYLDGTKQGTITLSGISSSNGNGSQMGGQGGMGGRR